MIKLYELRIGENLSQREIAKKFNVSQGTYNNWENSKTQPPLEQLIELAKFFGVSVDYLIGVSDYGDIVPENIRNLTSAQKLLLQYYDKLPAEAQLSFLNFLKDVTK